MALVGLGNIGAGGIWYSALMQEGVISTSQVARDSGSDGARQSPTGAPRGVMPLDFPGIELRFLRPAFLDVMISLIPGVT